MIGWRTPGRGRGRRCCASFDRSSNPKILLDDEEDFRHVFAELARAPLPMRAAYTTQFRGTLRDELPAQAARRARPWWLA